MFAAVFPLVRTRGLERPFDYAVPEDLAGRVDIGSLVAVPLGGRAVLGLVLGISATSSHSHRIRPLYAAVDLSPVPPELVDLAMRLHEHYLCPLASALWLVAPPPAALRLDTLLAGGPDGATRVTVRVAGLGRPAAILARGEGVPGRAGSRQRLALRLLESIGAMEESTLRRESGMSAAALKSLLATGAVRPANADEASGVSSGTTPHDVSPSGDRLRLLPEQETALETVRAALGEGGEVLLQGVTGSGKTEVYLRAAADVLATGRSVIVLVPEIGLTGQTVARLRERFPDYPPCVLHSGLSTGERLRAYVAAVEGRARLVVGARSAVFAPVRDLGLVIVDEEHDDSYKQNSEPRYDARTVARWRTQATGAALLTGSATPSVTTWAKVGRRARLTRRVDGGPPPALEVVDLRDTSTVLCSTLRTALVDCVDGGDKAILFLNRRGVAGSVSCGHCGHTWMCPACDVAYGLFRRGKELRCRICGRHEPAPHVCPECSSVDVGRHGVGTERLETEVGELLPGIETLRLDSDAATSHARLAQLLERFGATGPRVLVGTQMVTKGHHFPDVTLVGVVNADLALYFPDYRAEERTFAMLLQVGGRAGRGRRPGRVIVQTYDPEARPIVAAVEGDVDGFYRDELRRREALRYPPTTTLVVLVISAAEPQSAAEVARATAASLRGALPSEDVVLGPGPLVRERARFSCRIMVKTMETGKTLSSLRRHLSEGSAERRRKGVRIIPDVEPSRL